MPVLIRKIAAVLRRSNRLPEDDHNVISYQKLILDLDNYTVRVDNNTYP